MSSASRAAALREFARFTRAQYPEDVWPPMTDADHRAVHDAIAGRKTGAGGVSSDRVSADIMRRAAAQADLLADELIDERHASIRGDLETKDPSTGAGS